MKLIVWQTLYLTGAAALLPAAPFLFWQGKRTRRRVGVLPGAAGPTFGTAIPERGSSDGESAKLFVMGESTVAGLGARTHEFAFAGMFARRLGEHIGRRVEWDVVGKNGVTAEQTIRELLPQMPEKHYDFILLGLGGNDVLKLSSPVKWRRDMLDLLGRLRAAQPDAAIFLSNCPMIKLSPALPNPIRFFLWQLSKMHDANIREFSRDLERVVYYPQPRSLDIEGFFADGIHPSEKGYSDWTEAMMEHFAAHHKW